MIDSVCDFVQSCTACLLFSASSQHEPLLSSFARPLCTHILTSSMRHVSTAACARIAPARSDVHSHVVHSLRPYSLDVHSHVLLPLHPCSRVAQVHATVRWFLVECTKELNMTTKGQLDPSCKAKKQLKYNHEGVRVVVTKQPSRIPRHHGGVCL